MGHSIYIEGYDFPDGIESLGISTNLSDMYYGASKAAGYVFESFGEYINGKKLSELNVFFKALLDELISNPIKYKKLNPKNGWGSFQGLVDNIILILIACGENPDLVLEDWY